MGVRVGSGRAEWGRALITGAHPAGIRRVLARVVFRMVDHRSRARVRAARCSCGVGNHFLCPPLRRRRLAEEGDHHGRAGVSSSRPIGDRGRVRRLDLRDQGRPPGLATPPGGAVNRRRRLRVSGLAAVMVLAAAGCGVFPVSWTEG